MNVLSYFDGISCGQVALARAGIKVDNYYASEIDKYAMQIAQKNYPNTIQLGDVTKWKDFKIDFSKIDLILAGFPCQSWSLAGKGLGDKDERGKLFWVMIDAIKHIKSLNPNVKFLIENVKMKKEFEEYITSHIEESLGYIDKILIDSSLVSAQRRLRYYWTNIPNITQPEDKNILLKDIVHEKFNEIDFDIHPFNVNPCGHGMNGSDEKSKTLTTNKGEDQKICVPLSKYIVPFDETLIILDKDAQSGKLGYFRQDSQANRVYFSTGKANTLVAEAGGGAAKMSQYLFGNITKNYLQYDLSGNNYKSQDQRAYYLDNKHGTLPSCSGSSKCKVLVDDEKLNQKNVRDFYVLNNKNGQGVLIKGYIRKLTPIECERLQTLPDGYTDSISSAQRYKCLGNGWTVDVIAHILKGLK